jgi:hypothetical protein
MFFLLIYPKGWNPHHPAMSFNELGSVLRELACRLRIDPESLEFMLSDTTVSNLKPSSNALTHKGLLAITSTQHPSLFVPTERHGDFRSRVILAADETSSLQRRVCAALALKLAELRAKQDKLKLLLAQQTGDTTPVWFLKKVNTSYTRGVTVHASRSKALESIETLTERTEGGSEYVLQKAVERPWLHQGCKCHFRLYVFAFCAVGATVPRWYASNHVVIAAAPEPYCCSSVERGVQLSVERGDKGKGYWSMHGQGDRATAIWSLMYRWAMKFAAEVASGNGGGGSRGTGRSTAPLLEASELTTKQRECLAYELFGVDLIISGDETQIDKCHALALEVNAGPNQSEFEATMQLEMMEIVLGDAHPDLVKKKEDSKLKVSSAPTPTPAPALVPAPAFVPAASSTPHLTSHISHHVSHHVSHHISHHVSHHCRRERK